ncbi:2-dehydro-3-deoxy-D-arabinonate dehydratase [Actinopolyspora mzabensis]|uniref:2-dehydro-3-deoxy-D-arabinonate dehydratase n=1 Tax=Actinopolyspora mzabensis TaxID=995066 RepID=A0A1G8W2Y9_ACTMZ|nr:fumarylacetoacetate hydrolase family protein [Actinopolyspora mzabensis]SDJ72629.1 2-dehydro-3-deoxy-D-arabinonate dehydratase [Actinopolyspora mzabensis]
MHLVRYVDPGTGTARIGRHEGDRVTPLPSVESIAELLRLPATEFREFLERDNSADSTPESGARLLPPVDGRTEVWASGVTYERSRGARVEESEAGTVYVHVYDAPRPELFFKAPAWRVVTDGDPVAIRADSPLNVPEPELALVVNSRGEIVGLTACNDMSSRSLEGENPLYLPQAKVYNGSCGLSAGIRPIWQVDDPTDLRIRMTVRRDGDEVWRGETSTAKLHRSPRELVDALFAETDFPDGAVLATGTGIIPELDFTLAPDDLIEIEIDEVARLSNHVVRGRETTSWFTASPDQPKARA